MIKDIIDKLKEDWSIPRAPTPLHSKLVCEFFGGGKPVNVIHPAVSRDLKEFWLIADRAILFKDTEYGQWGLEVLTPHDAIEVTREVLTERPKEFLATDLVIGRFWGDSDLLFISGDEKKYGMVGVALPIDKRKDWFWVASDFSSFLQKFYEESYNFV